ncbi:hypothetical protein Vafri_2058, partial [Volvox africanus]
MVPAGAASRAHTLSPGVRYNVRPDDVLRFGRLSCRVLCGPDWLAREQQQPLQQGSLPQQQQQQRMVRPQPWQGNGEAGFQQQGLDGRLGSEHHRRGSPQHLQHRLNQGYSWQRQEQQQEGFISNWPSSPEALKRPSSAAIEHGKAGYMEGQQPGRKEERLGRVVSGDAGIGPTAGSPLPAASAYAMEGHTHGNSGAPGQSGQQRFVPPTQDVLVGPLLQLAEGQQHEAGMPAGCQLQQHQHGPLPVPVMQVIALMPPQGAGAAAGLSRAETLTAAAGPVGPGPPGAVHGAVQRSDAVLVHLHGKTRALLPGDAAAAMLPLQVQMPFPLAQVVSETEEEEEDGEEEYEAKEKVGKDVAGFAPRAGTTAPPAPPAPWWELADSLDDTHDGAGGASQSTGRPGEADTDTGSPGPGGGAEVLRTRTGEEVGNRSRQHPSRPLSVKLEPVNECGGLQSANGVHVSGAELPDAHMHPHSVGDDDRSVCDEDAVMCDLTQPPDEEVLGAPGDGFATADDAGVHDRVHEKQENQHQVPCSPTELGPSLPIPVGPRTLQDAYSDDDTAPPSPSSSPSLSDAANHVGTSLDEDNSDKAGTGGGRVMASGGADARSHLLESIDPTGMLLAERVPQTAAAAAPVVPPTQLVEEISLVPPPTHAAVPPPPQQWQQQPTCPSHSQQMDSHQSRFGQVVQPQCHKQQRRSSHPEGREETERSVWCVNGMSGEAGGGHELLPDAVGGSRRLLLGILTDPSPGSSPNPGSDAKMEGQPVSTDHHQHPEDLKPHFAPLRYLAQHLPQRLEDQHQLQPSLWPRTAAVAEASSKPPSPTVHGKDVGAPTSLAAAAAAVAATIGPGVAATVGIPAAGTEPPATGPPPSFNISQSASPWDLNAVRQRVGRLVSLLCSAESSEPSQEEFLQPRQLQQPPEQLPSGRSDAEDVAALGGPGQEGPGPRPDAVGMASSGRNTPVGLPTPAQPQPLLRQQPPEQHPLLLDASIVAVPPPRAAGEMRSLTGATANAELLQQPRPPPPSPVPPGSPSVSVRSFMIPGFGTQIAADALQQLMMMAESAPDRNAESSPGQRLDAAAAVLRRARDTVPTDSAAEHNREGNLGREMQVLGGAYRGGRADGGGRGRIGGAKVEQFGYSNADYVYEFPADPGDDGDEDYVQTPRRGRGRGRG